MDTKTVAIIILCFTVLMYAFGGIESKYACQDYKEQVQELQTRAEICETGWRLDNDLFNLQMCETVCNNKE
jgi:hypothetical protein